MIIDDIGIILHLRKFGESALIVSCFLADHGLLNGFWRPPKQKKSNGTDVLPGNLVRVRWWARLEEQLGTYQLEAEDNIIGKIAFNKADLALLNAVTQLLYLVLNEKEAQPQLFAKAYSLLKSLYQENLSLLEKVYCYFCFELEVLQYTGFGIDLSKCAVTSTTEDLTYISPRTGRVVCTAVGAPYADRLFSLPEFFQRNTLPANYDELHSALKITGYFLQKAIANEQYRPGQAASARQQVVQLLHV